jgi:hypothetical protein
VHGEGGYEQTGRASYGTEHGAAEATFSSPGVEGLGKLGEDDAGEGDGARLWLADGAQCEEVVGE